MTFVPHRTENSKRTQGVMQYFLVTKKQFQQLVPRSSSCRKSWRLPVGDVVQHSHEVRGRSGRTFLMCTAARSTPNSLLRL